jgi:hypothetical protein
MLRTHTNILTIALALKEPRAEDWTSGSNAQSGANLRVTEDTVLVGRLRAQRLVEVLQSPQRGRQPASGRPKYILKIYPNADAPGAQVVARPSKATHAIKAPTKSRIPWFLLASLAEAVTDEYLRQQRSILAQLDREIDSLEVQLRSTRDRSEKKRLADALQTVLYADENLEAEIVKRLHAKIANSEHLYSHYVECVDWESRSTFQKNT